MIVRLIVMFSFLWVLSGCLPALATECGKLCNNTQWENAIIEDLKIELKIIGNINDFNS
jgi:hypothetical protein